MKKKMFKSIISIVLCVAMMAALGGAVLARNGSDIVLGTLNTELSLPLQEMESAIAEAIANIDISHLQVTYRADSFGDVVPILTEEAWSKVIVELDRIAMSVITDELIRYVEAIEEMAMPFNYTVTQRIADAFNGADGMSAANRQTVIHYGTISAAGAAAQFPWDSERQDAYRHFMWSRHLARAINPVTARFATNNHEWAMAVRWHFDDSTNNALQISRRSVLRGWIMNDPNNAFNGFNDVFRDDEVKDFWNNREGINSISRFPTYRYAFITVFNILWNEGAITRNNLHAHGRRHAMFSSFWYLHFSA